MYSKQFEKFLLIESYFHRYSEPSIKTIIEKYTGKKYDNTDEAIASLSDEDLIRIFNNEKPRRISGVKYDGDAFYGKYYTYDGNELRLENSIENTKKKFIKILKSFDEKEYNILKAIVNVVVNNIKARDTEKIPFISHWLKKQDVAIEYMKLTGLNLGFTGKQWVKIYQYGICENRKKEFIISPEYIVAIYEAMKEFEEINVSEITFEKSEEIPEDLFDTIIDRTSEGKEITQIVKLKRILRSAIENHLKDNGEIPKHILIIGDVAVSKTMFLLEIARLKSALYISGDMRLGKAGLIEMLMESKPKFLLIDEIQHLDSKTLAVLLSLGETGYIGEFTREQQDLAKLNVMIIATTHPDDMKKLEMKTRGQGILDRFLKIELPQYSDEELIDLMKQVLVKRYGAKEEIAEYIAKKLIEKGIKSIRSAIRIYGIAKDNKEVIDDLIELVRC